MGRSVLAASVCAAALACAGQVSAKVVEITVNGTVNSGAPGSQPGVGLGDILTMTARFDDSGPAWTGSAGGLVEHTGSGFAFHVWPLPTTGDQFWRVDGDGFTWRSADDFYDGWNGGVILMDANYHLTGFSGSYLRSFSSTVPVLRLQEDDFTISGGVGDYGNTSDPGFWRGTWDLASATVKVDGVLVPQGPIPEPGTWAMMLFGFLAIGAVARARGANCERTARA